MRGGSDREWLEIALLETLQKCGKDNKTKKGNHKAIVVPCLYISFKPNCIESIWAVYR